MRIGGLQKVSLIDYPGKIAAVVFTQGCNFRCPYCHNRELVVPRHYCPTICVEDVMAFLRNRRRYLEGVVVTGGEPTFHNDITGFMARIKRMGYLVKLDTNGSRPDVLETIIELQLVDYIAMDVKSSMAKYSKAAGVPVDTVKIEESIALIRQSGIDYEFRTTVVNPFCGFQEICQLAAKLKGAKRYHLQAFHKSENIVNPKLETIQQASEKEVKCWEEKTGILC